MDAMNKAIKAVLREALDAVDVHPCDVHDDAVRAKGLYGPMADLYAAAIAPPVAAGSVDTEKLRNLAQAASPGPWKFKATPEGYSVSNGEHLLFACEHHDSWPPTQEDSKFIACANPVAVLAMLERAEKAEARVKELEADAMRWRYLRDLDHDLTGTAGQPCVALPNGMNSGYYLTGPEAIYAVDMSMAEAAQK